MWRTLILLIVGVAGSPCVFAGERSISIDHLEQRVKAFEKKIDFSRALLNHDASETIVFDWKHTGIPKHLDGWKLVDQDYVALEGRRPREIWEWGYTKNSEAVGVEITYHKAGKQEALMAIRSLANRSSMVDTPFIKGPAGLGTISSALPDGNTLYWAYRDLSFKVESTNKDLALKTAYWLNSIAEAHRQHR
jgi:hypothetical protein